LAGLKSEIAQSLPFASAEEEAILNLFRTSDCLDRAFQHKTRRWGLTATQYNVLRILRGAQPDGLPCAAIGERMIAAEPDITRLLGRLKVLKLVQQRRHPRDRRVVLTHITSAGLEILRAMDPMIRRLPHELLGHMSAAEIQQLIRLLESARRRCCDAHDRDAANGKSAAPV
jgi:MarR family transcriptional regulator, 2-MHQ and catechol-resistance regulon repressor